MDEYRFKQRLKKRGAHCLIGYVDPRTGVSKGFLCGCGQRTPPSKKDQKRIVRASLKRDLHKEINEEWL